MIYLPLDLGQGLSFFIWKTKGWKWMVPKVSSCPEKASGALGRGAGQVHGMALCGPAPARPPEGDEVIL